MNRYHVEIARDALRALAKLDKPVRRRVQAAIDGSRTPLLLGL